MLKLGITGVHGSGKTSYAKELADRYTDVGKTIYVVTEVARSCPHALGTVQAQDWIWQRQMSSEMYAMTLDVDVVICDRTVADNLMYYRNILDDAYNEARAVPGSYQRWWDLYKTMIRWMPSYSQVIRLPLNLEWLQADDDPIRPKDIEYAKRIDALFDRFVQLYVTENKRN